MRSFDRSFAFNLVLFLCICSLHSCSEFTPPAFSRRKLDESLQAKLDSSILLGESNFNIIITLKQTIHRALASISQETEAMQEVHDKAQVVHRRLMEHSQQSQEELLTFLSDENVASPTVLWITNQVALRGTSRKLIEDLLKRDEVAHVHEDTLVAAQGAQASHIYRNYGDMSTIPKPWGVKRCGADKVWELGVYGKDARAGFIDTGLRSSHQVFGKGRILAWKDVTNRKSIVYDDNYHGTHVAATAVGGLGIGIAPQASIVACKGLNYMGYLSGVVECAQFMICPHGNCAHTPHVIGNSWSFFSSWDTSFTAIIAAWRQAGIVGVFSTGNNFSPQTCADLIGAAPAIFDGIISVGATTKSRSLAKFSRQGSPQNPTTPDLSAPGEGILSASYEGDNTYMYQSGTSMAVPHVVGAILLVVSQAQRLGKHLTVDQIISLLTSTASSQELRIPQFACNYQNRFPNYAYGAGEIDIFEAVNRVQYV